MYHSITISIVEILTEDTFKTNQDLQENSLIDSSPIKFDALFNKIIRRKKIFILLSSIILSTSIANLIYRRVVNPVYRGAFTIMISDPIIDKNREFSSGSIENLAMNRESRKNCQKIRPKSFSPIQ